METMRILSFVVVEKGQWCQVIWPWETPEAFLYEAYGYGCTYRLSPGMGRSATQIPEARWIEIRPEDGPVHGEYNQNLYYGRLAGQGWALYRQFNVRGSHYLTQHGLDGIPRALLDAAYEYDPGQPVGKVQFAFRIETARQGAFAMTFYDWLRYFVSGQNGHISSMAITVTKSKE